MENDKVNISVTGFYSTGASAVVDLLTEFSDVSIALDKNQKGVERSYEHKVFSMHGGMFYLADTLLGMNSLLASDKAVNTFVDFNRNLYENDYVSFGSYKKLLGRDYWDAVEEFLNDIGAIPKKGHTNFSHYKRVRFSFVMCLLQIAAKIVYKKPIYKWGKQRILDKKPVYFTFPSEEIFYAAAKKFCDKYLVLCNKENTRFCIFDQLIYPRQIPVVDKYFSNLKLIFVVRDAREVFWANKYFLQKPPRNTKSFFPKDVEHFAKIWEGNVYIPPYNPENVMVVSFNDMVYKYDATVKAIMDFIGLEDASHIRKLQNFNPERSIKNTQTFMMTNEYFEESERLRELVPGLCYEYPFKNETSLKDMFCDSDRANQAAKK
jgi:hypothetical protein